MNEGLLNDLSLPEKADFVRQHGVFLEVQDYYSFFIHVYQVNKDHAKLVYDFSGSLVSIEYEVDSTGENYLSSQFEEKI